MKFSEKTLEVLKNFSAINQSVMFKKGTGIRTVSNMKTIVASAVVPDTFEGDAAVYDLSRFLATLSLFGASPEVQFGDSAFEITDDNRSVSYTYTSPDMLVSPPSKDLKVPSPELQAKVSWKDLQAVIKAANVLHLPEISFVVSGGSVVMKAVDRKNPTADSYSVTLDDVQVNADDAAVYIRTENLKLLPNDYDVSISTKGIAHFIGEDIQYWISLEAE
jgi:hypothetical protein